LHLLQQHKYETTQLLNNLAENNIRMKEERKRQLDNLRSKREIKIQQRDIGKTPRATPAPAAASRVTTKK